jgi:DNA repair protein RecN (Recombination protein N)
MLSKLSIKNYALIENLSVDFQDELSIITGETGAGKSILLGALSLVLGKRADLSTLKDSQKKCIIEAQFDISNYELDGFFQEQDIDFETETIVRREISPSGKSRAFINDTPTNLQVLQSLSDNLIDIHSQYQTLELSDSRFQFKIVDALANTSGYIESFQKELDMFNNRVRELEQLKKTQESEKQQYDYHLHLYNELKEADLRLGEQEDIERSLDRLNNVEWIKLNLSEAVALASNEEIGLQSLLNAFTSNLGKISKFSSEYESLHERALSIKIEFDDILNEVEHLNELVEINPSDLQKLNDRLQLIFDLQNKHSLGSIQDLLNYKETLSEKIALVENSSLEISRIESDLKQHTSKLNELGMSIFKERHKAIPILKEKIEGLLVEIGMENTRIQINLDHTNHYYRNGQDELKMLISANKGLHFGELKKVASGGELSRIMFSIKSILSEYLNLPTIIFDEIDTGISGEIAQKMAKMMREMANNMQVITITHLPQIASVGKTHYKVFKQDVDNDIVTQLKKLSDNERVIEIAEMLGGKNVTSTAIQHAKQLLN